MIQKWWTFDPDVHAELKAEGHSEDYYLQEPQLVSMHEMTDCSCKLKWCER